MQFKKNWRSGAAVTGKIAGVFGSGKSFLNTECYELQSKKLVDETSLTDVYKQNQQLEMELKLMREEVVKNQKTADQAEGIWFFDCYRLFLSWWHAFELMHRHIAQVQEGEGLPPDAS